MKFTTLARTATGLFFAMLTAAAVGGTGAERPTFADWLASEALKAKASIAANIAPADTRPGFVIASPSRRDPDYFFHWTRDSALTMSAILDIALTTADAAERDRSFQKLADYVDFTALTQQFDTLSGRRADHFANVGEPKFLPDGRGFTGDWGRPQGDGPALQAVVLLRLLAATGPAHGAPLAAQLPKLRAIVAADLDYLVAHGRETSFDLWEETRGHHFYTRMAQHRALVLGADEASRRGDLVSASRYQSEAARLEGALQQHWSEKDGYLLETMERDGGCDYKETNLDSGIVLASLHALGDDRLFGPSDDRVLATATHLRDAFDQLYPINHDAVDQSGEPLNAAIGRYPEDRYDGGLNTMGHPWVLLTLAMAELDYRLAVDLARTGRLDLTPRNLAFYARLPLQGLPLEKGTTLTLGKAPLAAILSALLADGDAYLRRVRHQTEADGQLSEQINRTTGKMSSARDLTWSYAAFLTALDSRGQAIRAAGH